MIPLGIAGSFHLKVTLVLVDIEVKFCGAFGTIEINQKSINVCLLSCAVVKEHCVGGPWPTVLMNDRLQVYNEWGATSVIVNIVLIEFIVICDTNCSLVHIRLYPTACPLWRVLTGSIHDNVTLREKNVVLVQLIGGAVGTIKQ